MNIEVTSRSLLVDRLMTAGYAFYQFPVIQLINPVYVGWRDLLSLPMEVRSRWTVGDPKKPDHGYIRRDGICRPDGEMEDRKHFFHFKADLVKFLREARVDFSRQSAWLEHCQVLYDASLELSRDIAASLDEVMPKYGILDSFDRATEQNLHTLRLVSYDPVTVIGGSMAKFHTDIGFISLQLEETHPGLLYENGQGVEKYRKLPGRIIVFPGDKAVKITGGRLRALNHGAAAQENVLNVSRLAAIFFSHVDIPLPQVA